MPKYTILVVFSVVLAGGAYLLWGLPDAQNQSTAMSTDAPDKSHGKGEMNPGDSAGNSNGEPTAKKVAPSDPESMVEQSLPRKQGPGPESLRMPDGTYMPVLNGAVGAPALDWPKDIPYSPVVKKVVDKGGLEWYVHEDGSYSITQNFYRADLGRVEPTTTLYNPKKSLPMDPGEAAKAREEMKKHEEDARRAGKKQ